MSLLAIFQFLTNLEIIMLQNKYVLLISQLDVESFFGKVNSRIRHQVVAATTYS